MKNFSRKEIVIKDLKHIYETTKKESNFNDSVILITGCAGFLGYYIMKYFDSYHSLLGVKKIIALDSFIIGDLPKWLKDIKDRNPKLFSINKFELGKDKISDLEDHQKVTHILHMASIASPTFYRKFPLETIDANIWGLRDLLDVYKNSNNLMGFIFFSSSEIYGDPDKDNIPTNENYRGYVSCTGPRACYDESKRFGETLSIVFRDKYGLPISIVRPFNNYGPGMKIEDKRLPADLAKCILSNNDIYIFSDGSPTRTFCYVADAIIGFLKVLFFKNHSEFNIGMDNPETSVIQIAEIYKEIGKLKYDYSGEIIKIINKDPNYLKDNPNRRQPDINKAKKLLNFNPTIDLKKGVSSYLDFLQDK